MAYASTRWLEASVLQRLAGIYWHDGRLDEARAVCEQVAEVFAEFGDRRQRAGALANLGLLNLSTGKYPAARNQLETAMELCRSVGDVATETAIAPNLALSFFHQGTPLQARAVLERSLEKLQALDLHAHRGHTLAILAMVVSLP